jgi:hypothetical protein
MSSSDLALKLEWYEIRDFLLGENRRARDVKRSLQLAATCQHPEAQWLAELFAGKDVHIVEAVREVFLAHDDARALCFSSIFLFPFDDARLRRSAELGYAFAQAKMAGLVFFHGAAADERSFAFAQRAALQGERDGFALLGYCFENGAGCDRDLIKAKENYLSASKLGDVNSMIFLGSKYLQDNDPQKWRWLGNAAARGDPFNTFLLSFSRVVKSFESDLSWAPVVFVIGRALQGHIDERERKIFRMGTDFYLRKGPANRAIDFFTNQCAAARRAVDAWCLIALRVNSKVNRDIRKKIGMMIWGLREEADYAVAESSTIRQ